MSWLVRNGESNEDLNIEGVQMNPRYKLDTLVLSVAERGRSQEGVGIYITCKAVVMLTVLE